jgi:hypothetical protein
MYLWVCGREASECVQAMVNASALSIACAYVPQGTGWSEGLVHISTSFCILIAKAHCNGKVIFKIRIRANIVVE